MVRKGKTTLAGATGADEQIRSIQEAFSAVSSSIRVLKVLCDVYDKGEYDIARDISVVISRLIDDELVHARIRKQIIFRSYSLPPDPANLLMQYLATAIRLDVTAGVGGVDPAITVTHVPVLGHFERQGRGPTALSFNDWWSAPTWIAGAARGDLIPLNEKLQTPFEERERLSRCNVVKIFRNKAGAHYDRVVDERSRRVAEQALELGEMTFNFGPGISYSLMQNPEVFNFRNSRAQAIMRHIGYELLMSSTGWNLDTIP